MWPVAGGDLPSATMNRRPSRLAVAALSAAMLVTACGDDDATTSASSTSVETTVDETSSTTEAPSTESSVGEPVDDEGDEGVIEISVAGGEVTGGGRHEVPLGATVVLRVTSDAADEVHVHGYDLYLDLAPGEPAELTFEATIPGVFEAELHDSGIVLAELQIQ